MPKDVFKNTMDDMRIGLKSMVSQASDIKTQIAKNDAEEGQDKGEMIANVMLALRHLEDAAMRFGKAIQASEGGVSPLGGPNTPGKVEVAATQSESETDNAEEAKS